MTRSRQARGVLIAGWLLAGGLPAACDVDYPEVVVVNRIAADVVIRNPSFNGCRWNVTLNYGDATAPRRCLPGRDKVHFQKLDLGMVFQQWEDTQGEPSALLWFNYQTVAEWSVDAGDFRVIDVTGGAALEQDFSIPGPYGH